MVGILNGSERLFEHFISGKREEVVKGICCAFSKFDYADAEDVVQEGSYEMWKKWSKGEINLKEKEFGNLWFGICKNIGRNWLRSRDWESEWDERLTEVIEEEDVMKKKRWLLDDVLDEMNEKDRNWIKWYYIDDLSLKEIAERYGFKNDKTAKNLKCRALKRLREAYAKALEKGEVTVETSLSYQLSV